MATIHQKFTGDAAQLEKEIEKLRKAYIKLQEQMAKAPKESAREMTLLGETVKRTAASMRSSITGALAGYASLGSAISLVTREMEHQRRLADEARRTNISVADSQAAVIKNIGDVNKEQLNQFFSGVERAGKDTGFSNVAQLNMAAADILSAAGGDQGKTIEILRTAAAFFKDAPADLAKFSGSMADVMKATGDEDAKRTMALMLSIQGQSRFTSLDAFKNVTPALASSVVTQRGVDPVRATREAAAVFAGIGQRAGDADGSVTKTAVANLSANLEQMFPAAGLSVIERLQKAQQANQATKDKLAESGFEGAMRPIIRDLLSSPESQTSMMVMEALKNINASEAFADRKKELLNSGTRQLELAGSARRTESSVQSFELGSDLARFSEIRSKLQQAIDKTQTAANAQILMGNFDFGRGATSPEQKAYETIERAIFDIRSNQAGPLGSLFYQAVPESQLTPERRQQVDLLREIKEEIKNLSRSSSQTATNTQRSAQIPAGAQRNVHQEAD